MKPTSRARTVTIGLTCLALASGCSSPSTPVAQPPVGCRPVDSSITAPPASTSALGSEHAIPTRAGQISASVTKIVDPAPGDSASPGCRIVEIDLRLRSGATTADTVDLFNLALVVGASGHAYTQYPGTEPRIGGRNGLDLTGLVGNTERRGPMHFQLPVDDQPRYFLVKDSTLAIDLTGPVAAVPVEAYRPGRWPKLGTRQVVKRLPGEQIDVTPLRVMDPVATTDGVGPRSRAVAVQLRIKVTGTKPWPLNPENLVGMMDDSGQKWLPGFVTGSAAGPNPGLQTALIASRHDGTDDWRELHQRKLVELDARIIRVQAARIAVAHALACQHEKGLFDCPNLAALVAARLAGSPLTEAHSH